MEESKTSPTAFQRIHTVRIEVEPENRVYAVILDLNLRLLSPDSDEPYSQDEILAFIYSAFSIIPPAKETSISKFFRHDLNEILGSYSLKKELKALGFTLSIFMNMKSPANRVLVLQAFNNLLLSFEDIFQSLDYSEVSDEEVQLVSKAIDSQIVLKSNPRKEVAPEITIVKTMINLFTTYFPEVEG